MCVFDRIINQNIRIVDPNPDEPNWRKVTSEKLFDAMKEHGPEKSAGIWLISSNVK